MTRRSSLSIGAWRAGRCAVVALVLLGAVSAAARPCATIERLEALRHQTSVALSLGLGARPESTVVVEDSARYPLRLHAVAGVDRATVTHVLDALESAWALQVDGAGYPPPLGDGAAGGDARFDAYLVPLPPGIGGITVPEPDANPDDGRSAAPAFLQLDPTLGASLLEAYAHHELQHALQFALDTREHLMWVESTAVLWEVRGAPAVEDWHLALPDFQGNPHAPVVAHAAQMEGLAVRPASRYEYGAVLFPLYLDEVHGAGDGTLLARLWRAAGQPDAVAENEPDLLKALAAEGVDMAAAVVDFSTWRALVGPFAVDGDGPPASLPASAVLGATTWNAETLVGAEVTTGPHEGPYPLGCAVFTLGGLPQVPNVPLRVRVRGTAEGQQVAIGAAVFDPEAGTAERSSSAVGSTAVLDVVLPAPAVLFLSLCDVTLADPDAAFVHQPIAYSARRLDVESPPPDPADEPTDEDDAPSGPPTADDEAEGAGCQQSGDPRKMRSAVGALALVVGFLGLVVRALRQARRRRLYRRDP